MVTQNEILLREGKTISFEYAIIILPFKVVQAIQDSPGLGKRGIIPINSKCQHKTSPDIKFIDTFDECSRCIRLVPFLASTKNIFWLI